jgi:hypothetical protein
MRTVVLADLRGRHPQAHGAERGAEASALVQLRLCDSRPIEIAPTFRVKEQSGRDTITRL